MPYQIAKITDYNDSATPSAWSLDSGATYAFDNLPDRVVPVKSQLQLMQREGIDGQAIKRIGKRGKPFRFRAIIYFQNHADVYTFHDAYDALIGADLGVYVNQDGYESGPYDISSVEIDPRSHRYLAKVAGITLAANPTRRAVYFLTMTARPI